MAHVPGLYRGRDAARLGPLAVAGALAATLGAQLAGVLVSPDARDLLAVAPSQSAAHAVDRVQEAAGAAVGVVVLVLVLQRLLVARGVARRSQGPLLAAAAVAALVGLAWLGRVIATDGKAPTFETIARAAFVCLPVAVVAESCGHASAVPAGRISSSSCGRRRRGRCATGSPARSAIRRSRSPTGSRAAATSTRSAGRSSSRRRRPGRHPPDRRRRAGGDADPRSRAAGRARARRIRARRRRARARERAPRGGAARRSSRRCAPPARGSSPPATPSAAGIERDLHDGAQQRLVDASRARSASRRRASTPARAAPLAARAGRARGGDRRAARARARDPPGAPRATRASRPARRGARRGGRRAGRGARSVPRRGCPTPVEFAAYFVVAEALTNASSTPRRAGLGRARAAARLARVDRRGRRRGGADRRGLRPRGPARPARGARRPTRGRQPRRATGRRSVRSSRAGRDRGRRVAAPRGHRAPARRGTASRSSRRPTTPTTLLRRCATRRPGPRRRRRPDAADAHRRGPARRARDPRAPPGDRRARALAVPGARLRAAADRASSPRGSATCSRIASAAWSELARRRAPGRGGRVRRRPGRSSRSCSPRPRQVDPLEELTAARARDPRPDRRGPLEPRHLRGALAQPEDGRDAHPRALRQARDPRGAGRQPPRARRARLPRALRRRSPGSEDVAAGGAGQARHHGRDGSACPRGRRGPARPGVGRAAGSRVAARDSRSARGSATARSTARSSRCCSRLHPRRGRAGAARDRGVPRLQPARARRPPRAPLRALGSRRRRLLRGVLVDDAHARARLGAARDRGRALLRARLRPRPPARARARLAARAADAAQATRALRAVLLGLYGLILLLLVQAKELAGSPSWDGSAVSPRLGRAARPSSSSGRRGCSRTGCSHGATCSRAPC